MYIKAFSEVSQGIWAHTALHGTASVGLWNPTGFHSKTSTPNHTASEDHVPQREFKLKAAKRIYINIHKHAYKQTYIQ